MANRNNLIDIAASFTTFSEKQRLMEKKSHPLQP